MNDRLRTSPDQPTSFCRRWKIIELSLFGSVLRQDFRADSDVDVLVKFASDARWSLLDMVRMQEQISAIVGRKADLVDIRGLRNPFRRREILNTREIVYAS
ncbi:MAG TPA: nucleotidyltransferase domain-containing protein [Pyrinomonadaceae bacterium]|nr:nucleotidyltransferase domain-containing protein [Pyrinomonadaceae bacterium]